MLDGAPIAYWIGFHVVVLVLILVDLVALGRAEKASRTQHNFLFVLLLLALATCFGLWIGQVEGRQSGLEFAAGYLIELSLSIDNLFVFLLMFRSFGLEPEAQRKALLLGIVGAIVMRAVFIFAGIALLERFAWIEYVFGALLLVAAVRLLRGKKKKEGDTPPEPAKWIGQRARRWASSPRGTFIVA